MKYLIGIDGGGTNSRLLAVDTEGNVIGTCCGKTTNVESNPASVVIYNFKMLINAFCNTYHCSLEDCIGLCFGTAGVDSEASRRWVEQMLDDLGLPCPQKVVNDAVIALYANTYGSPGIMLISGTGSIAYGINERHEVWRAGGFDYLVGDEGSAYWVAKQGVSAALRAMDRTGETTCILNDICKHLHLSSADEILDYVYSKNKSKLAGLCIIVSDACRKGDAVANRIMDAAAEELAHLVTTVARVLHMEEAPYPLILGGGFILHDELLRSRVKKLLTEKTPYLTISNTKNPAEWGAVYMAAELADITLPETIRQAM